VSFLFYEVKKNCLIPCGTQYKLAGKNLIFKLWEKAGCPLNSGWHMSANDLIGAQTSGAGSGDSHSLLVDFDPNSKARIGILRILDIYAYTYGKEGKAVWNPIMIRLEDVFYKEYENQISEIERKEVMQAIPIPKSEKESIEFLYLNPANGWRWGRNGSTNAVFIQNEAREYFRKFF